MLEKRCNFFREIELANVLIEELILKKYNELKYDINNKKLIEEYNMLKSMSNNLFDKSARAEIFALANIEWNV